VAQRQTRLGHDRRGGTKVGVVEVGCNESRHSQSGVRGELARTR
jgi:hypothetical protein